MDVYNFIFNTRMGLAILIIGGMILFTIVAFVLEKGTRERYRDRPKTDDDFGFDNMDDLPFDGPDEGKPETAEERAARKKREKERERKEQEREERFEKFQDDVADGGLLGALGVNIGDDEDDEDDTGGKGGDD